METMELHGIISNIRSMSSFAGKFLGKGKEYDQLLSYIIEEEHYYSDNEDKQRRDWMPVTEEIKSHFGLTDSEIKRLVTDIYNDLIDGGGNYFDFKETEYILQFHKGDEYFTARTKSLPVIPRKGEEMTIPYFAELLGTIFFEVDNISYDFDDGKISVWICCNEKDLDSEEVKAV
jgi:hypothetical protein